MASNDLARICTKKNFDLAWIRLQTSQDRITKEFWRNNVGVAHLSAESVIRRVRKRLRNEQYAPERSCIVSLPKASGLLRHMTLLTTEDHLVYQAILNILAQKISSKLRKHYGRALFSNMYAGKDSKFFFRPWQKGYQQFSEQCRSAHQSGLEWMMSFDFASYYDSIDHRMLENLLTNLFGAHDELVATLTTMLSYWTSANDSDARLPTLYLGQGIPQGPPPSSMLAEVPLWYLDQHMIKMTSVRYLRYADDIRIFGRTKAEVQYATAILDRLARDIGIYPQAGKYSIERIDDIEETIKKVSLNFDEEEMSEDAERFLMSLDTGVSEDDHVRFIVSSLHSIIDSNGLELTGNDTTLKFALATIAASDGLAHLVARALCSRLDLAEPLFRYLGRCPKLNASTLDELISLAESTQHYPYIVSKCLGVLHDHRKGIQGPRKRRLVRLVKKVMSSKGSRVDCVLESKARIVGVALGVVSVPEVEQWITAQATNWWSKAHFATHVDESSIGRAALSGMLRELTHHQSPDVSRAAANRLVILGESIQGTEDEDARATFAAHGITTTRRSPTNNRITRNINRLLQADGIERPVSGVEFVKLFEDDLPVIEQYIAQLRSSMRSDRTQFVLEVDALLEIVFTKVLGLHRYTFVNNAGQSTLCTLRTHLIRKSVDFSNDYPKLCNFGRAWNTMRNRCKAAHAYFTAGGGRKRNRRVYYREMVKELSSLPDALNELARDWPL